MAEPTLILSFTRLSSTHHRFEFRRPDGVGEALELGGTLAHDLIHLATESEAGLRGSFYGLLAKIGGYEELVVNGGAALGGEAAITERVVGAFSGADDVLDGEAFAAWVAEYQELYDERAPRWFTPDFVLAVRERLRRLTDRWNATPFGETMTLTFPMEG